MLIAAEHIVGPEQILEPGWVQVTDGTITQVGAGSCPFAPDLRAHWLVPGYIDIHLHGGGGYDLSASPEQLAEGLRFHRAHGTISALVSLVTAPISQLCEQLSMIADAAAYEPGILGAHLEGPFLSAARCGAHDPSQLRVPDRTTVEQLLTAGRGVLRAVTIAPELPGAIEAIDAFVRAGVVVAVGHTEADYDLTCRAFEHGARLATHLFNAMPELSHRHPGPVGASLDSNAYVEIINDGVHVHRSLVRLVAARSPQRLVLVTDAIMAAGSPDGDYQLGSQRVRVTHGQARLVDGGALAGSTLTMDRAVRRAVTEVGLTVRQAMDAATLHPAHVLGLHDQIGSIVAGQRADLLALDADLCIQNVIVGGVVQATDAPDTERKRTG